MSESSKKKNFEGTLDKLEKIVNELEGGEVSLDQSIKKFEKGIELYNECRDFLADAEQKIKVLTDSLKEEEYSENE
jgi:exodeoxyribonuclease VII small subunit